MCLRCSPGLFRHGGGQPKSRSPEAAPPVAPRKARNPRPPQRAKFPNRPNRHPQMAESPAAAKAAAMDRRSRLGRGAAVHPAHRANTIPRTGGGGKPPPYRSERIGYPMDFGASWRRDTSVPPYEPYGQSVRKCRAAPVCAAVRYQRSFHMRTGANAYRTMQHSIVRCAGRCGHRPLQSQYALPTSSRRHCAAKTAVPGRMRTGYRSERIGYPVNFGASWRRDTSVPPYEPYGQSVRKCRAAPVCAAVRYQRSFHMRTRANVYRTPSGAVKDAGPYDRGKNGTMSHEPP